MTTLENCTKSKICALIIVTAIASGGLFAGVTTAVIFKKHNLNSKPIDTDEHKNSNETLKTSISTNDNFTTTVLTTVDLTLNQSTTANSSSEVISNISSTVVPVYQERTNTHSILILSPNGNAPKPSIINSLSLTDPYYEKTLFVKSGYGLIEESCSLIHQGTMYVYGGVNQKQILKLDCKGKGLNNMADLSFEFADGSCASNNEQVLLCFFKSDRKQCYLSTDPIKSFTQTEKSIHKHNQGTTAVSKGEFLKIQCKSFTRQNEVYLQNTKSLFKNTFSLLDMMTLKD